MNVCVMPGRGGGVNRGMLVKPKTNSMKRTFGYAAAKDWNYNSKNSKSIHL